MHAAATAAMEAAAAVAVKAPEQLRAKAATIHSKTKARLPAARWRRVGQEEQVAMRRPSTLGRWLSATPARALRRRLVSSRSMRPLMLAVTCLARLVHRRGRRSGGTRGEAEKEDEGEQ